MIALARRGAPTLMVAALFAACAPSGLGSTCRFSGDDATPCGTCIAKSCQDRVDACCGDSTCEIGLGALDRCATGSGCDGLASSAPELAACVASSCAMCGVASSADAGARDASKPTDAAALYETSCSEPGTFGCICSPGGGSDVDCSEASTGGGVCCADRGWPAEDTLCSCAPFTCEPVFGSSFVDVRCRLEELHTGITVGTGSKCCVDPFLKECKCGPSDMGCEPSNVVPRCDASTMRCTPSRSRVESCSFR